MNSTGRTSTPTDSKKHYMDIKLSQQKGLAVVLLLLVSLFMVPSNANTAEAANLEEINNQINQVTKNLDTKRGEATSMKN